VPAAAADLRPLRRTSRAELGLATAALAAAALLGSLAPPVAGQPVASQGISASGSDFATTIRVKLTAASAEPGPNKFVVRVQDYDSGDTVQAARVRLQFTPLDDPGVASTALTLRRGAGGTFTGSGPNLTFDGRWRVSVLVERAGDSVEVPLAVDVRGPVHALSVLRPPGVAPKYTMEIQGVGYIQIAPVPEREGPSRLGVAVFDDFEIDANVRHIVVTVKAGDGPTRQQVVRRLSSGRFEADVDLARGKNDVAVIARTTDDARLRGVFTLQVPGR
jgi:hypothetical protein